MQWFDNNEFWDDMYPFLFKEERYKNTEQEIDFVLSQVQNPVRSILDLCCGPGRHSISLAKRGYKITGVDRTSDYLKIATEGSSKEQVEIEWIQEDMLSFLRPDFFDLIISMFTSIGYYENESDNLKVFKNMYDNLKPGGTVFIDTIGKEIIAENFHETNIEELPGGIMLVQYSKITADWKGNQNKWILIKNGEVKTFEFSLSIYSGIELKNILLNSGFKNVSLFGDFEGNEYTKGASRLIAVAYK